MKVLLTGGTGFVGMNVVEKLLDEGDEVVLYALTTPSSRVASYLRNRRDGCRLVLGDVLDAEALDRVMRTHRVDAVVHAAAITPDVRRECSIPEDIINVNVMGTVAALEAARRNDVAKFLYLSSVEAYGQAAYEDRELVEGVVVPRPNSLYQIGKFAAERIAIRYRELFGMDVAAARIGEVFGAWEVESGVRDTLSVPYQAAQLALLGMKAVLPREGKKTWVYSKDVAEGIYALLTCGELRHDVYNLGSGFTWSIEEWCAALSREYRDFAYELSADPEKANIRFYNEKDHSPLNIDRLMADTGFVPRYDMEEALEDYTAWLGRYVPSVN